MCSNLITFAHWHIATASIPTQERGNEMSHPKTPATISEAEALPHESYNAIKGFEALQGEFTPEFWNY